MIEMSAGSAADALYEMEGLLWFYWSEGGQYQYGGGVWVESTRWFNNGVFFRFVRDGKGSRVEIGDKWHSRLMFVGRVKGGAIVYDEAQPAGGKKGGEARGLIKSALLDAYGCVGEIKGGLKATETYGWKPRLKRMQEERHGNDRIK